MEVRMLYDQNRRPTGKTIQKGEKVPEGLFYLVVAIAIETKNKKFLIQKRSKEKGGMWATTAGHPFANENSLEGIQREVKEELGLDIQNEELKLFKTIQQENKIVDFYYVNLEIKDEICLQEEEVEDYQFATKEEILKMIEEKDFHQAHTEIMQDCFAYLERGNEYV